ncbi:WbqC family protein [Muriicola sp. Z0-33]|uniref:WbqC family protein n=1 Tax=Muriicola sp. Z0-33 TaxID=2816957 RepID=UPI0022372D98|nr:WbqC family protein [Muriicola sp. Z0-33]MCW5515817.1 WbqC family protein [Muriicola sp. Z0-33]
MKFLLHPTYFPSILHFGLLAQHDITWEIWDNYQKQTYRNRCYISTDQGKHMLSIPIKHVGGEQGRQLFKEVQLDNTYQWQRQHWRTLQTAYRTSPFFEYYEEDLMPLFEREFELLIDFNFETIDVLCKCLQIEMPKDKSASYQTHLTGLTDARHLVNAKKELLISPEEYVQVFGDRHGFIGNLSVLDLLFNEGTSALTYLESLDIKFMYA